MQQARLKIGLVGDFRVHDAFGNDLAPRGAKPRALLALLCLSPGRRRQRRWLEDKLWSDRGQAQAASSLRQALTQLRRALGGCAGALVTDREWVALSADVATDLDDEAEAARAFRQGRQLLEGFDIRDPEFEDWLRDERARVEAAAAAAAAAPAPPPDQPALQQAPDQGLETFLAQALADQVAGLVSELAVVETYTPTMASVLLGPPEQGLQLGIRTIAEGSLAQVLARLEAVPARQLLWSRRMSFSGFGLHDVGSDAFFRFAHDAAEAMSQAMPRILGGTVERTRAHAMALEGVREMFSFDPPRLGRADELLGAAWETAPAPVYDAWRALLKTVMAVERNDAAPEALRAQADELSRRALEAGYGNATVLGLVAQVRLTLDRKPDLGAALAEDARAANPGNAFAEMAAASAHMRAGEADAGLRTALRAGQIARNSLIRHWWEMSCCLAQIANGQFQDAIRSAEAVHLRAPRFKPPLRHLYALYTYFGDFENARRVSQRLKELEPDFSLRRIREDPDYPASVIRGSPLVHLRDVAS